MLKYLQIPTPHFVQENLLQMNSFSSSDIKVKKLFQKVLDNLLLERVGLYDTGYIHPEATTSSSRGGFHQGFFVEVGIHSESNLSILNPSFI